MYGGHGSLDHGARGVLLGLGELEDGGVRVIW